MRFPSCMKVMRSATSRAKPISWVTTTMVVFDSSARFLITARTSPNSDASR